MNEISDAQLIESLRRQMTKSVARRVVEPPGPMPTLVTLAEAPLCV